MEASRNLERLSSLFKIFQAEESDSIRAPSPISTAFKPATTHDAELILRIRRALGDRLDDVVMGFDTTQPTVARRGRRVTELKGDGGQTGSSDRDGENRKDGNTEGVAEEGSRPQAESSSTLTASLDMQKEVRVAGQLTARQLDTNLQMVMARIENKDSVVLEGAAAHHVSSVIEVILKKTYPNENQRKRDAGKLIALILRCHGYYTYEHSARMIDLASALADIVGRGDPETHRRLADGVTYKDIGEVEFLMSKRSPRQRQALTEYLAGTSMAEAGLLHDIGKIKVPKEILYKRGGLTPEEARIMQMHPIYGAQILERIPPLAHAAPAARHHHERYDGKGYPDRLKGEQIPFEARIIAIVDAFDAMVADRPYRKGLPLNVCRKELLNGRAKQFDPKLVDAFMEVLDDKFVRGHTSMDDYRLGPDTEQRNSFAVPGRGANDSLVFSAAV